MLLNGLMATAPRQKFNLELPRDLKAAADEIAKRWGPKKKWLVLAVAVVAFLEKDDDEQSALVKRVNDAEMGFSTYTGLFSDIEKNRVAMKMILRSDVEDVEGVKRPGGAAGVAGKRQKTPVR